MYNLNDLFRPNGPFYTTINIIQRPNYLQTTYLSTSKSSNNSKSEIEPNEQRAASSTAYPLSTFDFLNLATNMI